MWNPENPSSSDSYDWEHGWLTSAQIRDMLEKKKDEVIQENQDNINIQEKITAALGVINDIQKKIEANEWVLGRYAKAYRITRWKNKLSELSNHYRNNHTILEQNKSIDNLAEEIDLAENETLQNFRGYLSYYMGLQMADTLYSSDLEELIDNPEWKTRYRLPADVDHYWCIKFLPWSEKIGNKDMTLGDLYFFAEYRWVVGYVRESTDETIYRYEKDGELRETTNEGTARENGWSPLRSSAEIDTRDYSYILDYSKCSEEIKNSVRAKLHILQDVVVVPEGIISKVEKTDKNDFTDKDLIFEIKYDKDGLVMIDGVNPNAMTPNTMTIRDFPVWAWLTIQEKWWYEIWRLDENYELVREYGTLSEEDFDRDFRGDDFEQENVGDCWMLSFLDSFINFWDYELLIRTNVEKNEQGWYDIYLPMRYPPEEKGTLYRITSKELCLKQYGTDGKEMKLVTWKKWIKCLVWALSKSCTWITDAPADFTKLQAGIGLNTAELLLGKSFGKISFMDKSFVKWIEKNVGDLLSKDRKRMALAYLKHTSGFTGVTTLWELWGAVLKYLSGKSGSDFLEIFVNYLQMFNKETDMMTVTVLRGDEWMEEHWTQLWGTPHVLSVEKVYKNEKGEWLVKLSNPHDADAKKGNPVYIPPMPFGEFLSRCFEFTFVSKDKEKTKSYENSACKTNKDTKLIMKVLNLGAKGRGSGDFNSQKFNHTDTYWKDLSKKPLDWMKRLPGAKEPNFTDNLIRITQNGNYARHVNRPTGEIEFKKQQITAEDLVWNLKTGTLSDAEVSFKDGKWIDIKRQGKQSVTVVVKSWVVKKEIVFDAIVTDDKIELKVTDEKTELEWEISNRDSFSFEPDAKLTEVIYLQKKITAEYLVWDLKRYLPGATVKFKDGKWIDNTKSTPQPVTVIVEHWNEKEEFNFTVTIDRDNNIIKIDKQEEKWREGNYHLISSYGKETYYKWVTNNWTPQLQFVIWNQTFQLNQSTFGDDSSDRKDRVYRFINFINYVRKKVEQDNSDMNFSIDKQTLVINNGQYKIEELEKNLGIWGDDSAEIDSILHMLNIIGNKHFQ